MAQKILVIYASKYGATAEIAERIGQTLVDQGLACSVLPAQDVQGLNAYHAVVLGSAVYMGQWRKEARQFLKRHQQELSQRKVWLFSTGPTGDGEAEELLHGWVLPKSLQPIVDSIGVQEIAVFHGNIQVERLNSFEKWILKKVHAASGDFRDWQAITAWAESIAQALPAASA